MPQKHNGERIIDQIFPFYQSLTNDANHRYLSWEHCFRYFQKRKDLITEEKRDTACLHLAFYLASWGMYRGSSALLWKDYKIHKLAVQTLLKLDYARLWDLDFKDSSRDNDTANLIVLLSDDLKKTYQDLITEVNGKKKQHKPSETLITKILLGTVGCTPACDRFFIVGFRKKKKYSRFGENFLSQVFEFYREHECEFLQAQDAIKDLSGTCYPPMKLVDMYFWKLGSDSDAKK